MKFLIVNLPTSMLGTYNKEGEYVPSPRSVKMRDALALELRDAYMKGKCDQ